MEYKTGRFGIKEWKKPVCLLTHPVPNVHEDMFDKDVEQMESLEIIEHENDSE